MIGLVLAILIGLWFLPSLVRARDSYTPYDEVMYISSGSRNYVERAINLGSWQTNVMLEVYCASHTSDPLNTVVMTKGNYTLFQDGNPSYEVYHSSGTFWQIDYDILLPPTSEEDPEYYLVIQNPNPRTITVKQNKHKL